MPRHTGRRLAVSLTSAAAAVALALTGCASTPATSRSAASTTDRHGGEITIGEVTYPTSFQVSSSSGWPANNFVNNVVDRLVYLEPTTNEITPWLATSWEVDPTSTSFTFHLRDGVTFSDGSVFDAEVVKANLEQWAFGDDALGIAPSPDYNKYASSEVIDAHTITVHLSSPDSQFLTLLAWGQSGFISTSALALSNDAQSRPENVIGTGPFVVESAIPDQQVVLVRRKGYDWGPKAFDNPGEAYLDKVTFVYIEEPSSRTGALQSGQVDLIRGVQAVDEPILASAGYQILPGRVTSGLSFHLSLRPSNPILADINVRRAIQHGIDREAIVHDLLTDSYVAADSVIAHESFGFVDHSADVKYDPALSEKLLKESGWVKNKDGIYEKDGKTLTVYAAASAQDQSTYQAFELIAQQLAQVGIDFKPTVGDNAYSAQAGKDASIGSYTTTTHDFDAIATYYDPRDSNRLLAVLPGYETLVDQFRAVPWDDTEGRAAAVAALQDYLFDNALAEPLWDVVHVHAARPELKGFVVDARARLELAEFWLQK